VPFFGYNKFNFLNRNKKRKDDAPMADATAVFSLRDEQDQELRAALQEIYSALQEKGYNPVNQIVGYLLSEDPTYITTYKNARNLIRKIDRDDLLQSMVRSYVGQA